MLTKEAAGGEGVFYAGGKDRVFDVCSFMPSRRQTGRAGGIDSTQLRREGRVAVVDQFPRSRKPRPASIVEAPRTTKIFAAITFSAHGGIP